MKGFLILIFLLLLNFSVTSQPNICNGKPQMKPFCAEACIICDINGFTGRNSSSIVGQAPPGFCTLKVHHMQWIGFIAGSVNLSLEITVSNCQLNRGLEIGLYEGIDCKNFSKISECDTDVRPNQKRIFTNTKPLVIGQYYYLIMDGSSNDICDWSIKVLSGSTKANPLELAPNIKAPPVICQNDKIDLSTDGIIGATNYEWKVDDVNVGSTPTINYKFPFAGTYKVCLKATNVCDKSPQECKKIVVLPSKLTSQMIQLCYGECHEYQGDKYCETGVYDVVLKTMNGCDSIIRLDVVVDDRITKFERYYICEGDSLKFGKDKFFTQGMHSTILDNKDGCQIYLTFELTIIYCKIEVSESVVNVNCAGDYTGEITLYIKKATPPLTYNGYKVENPSVKFNGSIERLDQEIKVTGLNTGNYIFELRDTFGNQYVSNIAVIQPAPIVSNLSLSNFNGFQVPCFGSAEGKLTINTTGGTPPFIYNLNALTFTQNSVDSLSKGNYKLIVEDKNGCLTEKSFLITEPPSIKAIYKVTKPNCTDISTGIIDLSEAIGGVSPYTFILDSENNFTSSIFTHLKPGIHQLTIVDRNGCSRLESIKIDSIIIPEISLTKDYYQISLGDSIALDIKTNDFSNTIYWSPAIGLSCNECFEPIARPFDNMVYNMVVTSRDSCSVSQKITIEVLKKRSFIISNVFTPNNDGMNDKVTYFAGNDVASIHDFMLYDRWGNLITLHTTLPKGLQSIESLEMFQGKALQNGAYIYTVSIVYIDGYKQRYSGTITVLK